MANPSPTGIYVLCKKRTELTKHHDNTLGVTIMICRSRHDVLEWYKQFIEEMPKRKQC